MKNLLTSVCIIVLAGLFLSIPLFAAGPPAFPTAEGYGMYATGGRGGKVVAVTNLLDDAQGSIPGSFRWALRQYPNEPLTIVFKTSGVINLVTQLRAKRTAGTTIAGQTAPGDGICIRGAKCNFGGSQNLIIRHLRFRIGLKEFEGTDSTAFIEGGSIGIENASNWILDHCTFGWSGEENMTIYDNTFTTVQWCLVHEGLYNSGHGKGNRGYGAQWGGQTATYHHNLLAHNNSRSPRFNGARSNDIRVLIDYVNNVNYNWGGENSCYGGDMVEGRSHYVNMINNYYKPGPARPGNRSSNFVRASFNGNQQTWQIPLWYMNGNYMEGSANSNCNTNNYNGLNADEYIAKGIAKSSIISATPFDVPYAVTTETAQQAYQSVLAGAGAFPRDTVDSRIVDEVRKGIAYYGGQTMGAGKGIIDRPSDVGGYPEYQTYDTIVDMDQDGMDDLWELEHGLDPLNPEDRNLKLSSGYTVLEAYINGLVGEQIPFDTNDYRYYDIIVAKDGSGDFETLSAAIDALPEGDERRLIYVKKGLYEEKVYIGSHSVSLNKVISIVGEHRDSVIISWNDYNGKEIYYYGSSTPTIAGTPQSATMTVNAPDFYMENVTVQNTYTSAQAVAIYHVGDRQTFKNCRFKGFQDTQYLKKGRRSFYYNCLIEGGTDFICAGGTAYYYQCVIKSLKGGYYITAPEDITHSVRLSTGKNLYYGFIFKDCQLQAEEGVPAGSVYLGRPWQENSGAVYLQCRLGSHINPAGWSTWSGDNHLSSSFAEYRNLNAEGTAEADVSGRAEWSIQLSDKDYYDHLGLNKIFNMQTAYQPLPLVITPAAVQNLRVSNNLLSWSAVENAAAYAVYLNSDLIGFSDTTLYADMVYRSGAKNYTVRALGAQGQLGLPAGQSDTLTVALLDSLLNPVAPQEPDALFYPDFTGSISLQNGVLSFAAPTGYWIHSLDGQLIKTQQNVREASLYSIKRGVYILTTRDALNRVSRIKFQW